MDRRRDRTSAELDRYTSELTSSVAMQENSASSLGVWIVGSYALDEQAAPSAHAFTHSCAEQLGSALATPQIQVVTGFSDLLLDLCASHRNHGHAVGAPPAIMLHGSIRGLDPREYFWGLLRLRLDAVILLRGRFQGRSRGEVEAAMKSRLPVFALTSTGGAASARLPGMTAIDDPDPGDACRHVLRALRSIQPE